MAHAKKIGKLHFFGVAMVTVEQCPKVNILGGKNQHLIRTQLPAPPYIKVLHYYVMSHPAWTTQLTLFNSTNSTRAGFIDYVNWSL